MKDIQNYEGLYAITSCGKVWSYKSQMFLTPREHNGYQRIALYKDGVAKDFLIHRLVAEAYIPNPENKPQVNHLDEIKTHNYISNLEWATAKENLNYGTRSKRLGKNHCKSVYCVELDKTFESLKLAAEELGITQAGISMVCKGKRKTCGGYHWEYYNAAN